MGDDHLYVKRSSLVADSFSCVLPLLLSVAWAHDGSTVGCTSGDELSMRFDCAPV